MYSIPHLMSNCCIDKKIHLTFEFLQGWCKNAVVFWFQVEQTAAGLLAVGLKRGDRLGMWGPNIYEWILMQFATAKAGIILVSVFHFLWDLVCLSIYQQLVSDLFEFIVILQVSVNPAYQLQEAEFALRKVS